MVKLFTIILLAFFFSLNVKADISPKSSGHDMGMGLGSLKGKKGGGTPAPTGYLLIDTGSRLLIDTGSAFLIQ